MNGHCFLFSRLLKIGTVRRVITFNAAKFVQSCPSTTQPYLRLLRVDRPIGSFLLFWPSSWGISMATPAACFPDPFISSLFFIGSFTMRGSACIINDWWDKDFDKMVCLASSEALSTSLVERTRSRPLAANELTSFHALTLLGGGLSVSLFILLQLNTYTQLLGVCSLIPVVMYPLAKRFTHWPQVCLGLTINWGAMMGYSAVVGHCNWPVVVPLFAACAAWTVIYDTIYAHQDKHDDEKVGVKSLAILLTDRYTKPVLAGFAATMISLLTISGVAAGQTWPYYAGVIFTGSHLAWQISSVNLNNPDDCLRKFKSQNIVGPILLGGIITGTLLK